MLTVVMTWGFINREAINLSHIRGQARFLWKETVTPK